MDPAERCRQSVTSSAFRFYALESFGRCRPVGLSGNSEARRPPTFDRPSARAGAFWCRRQRERTGGATAMPTSRRQVRHTTRENFLYSLKASLSSGGMRSQQRHDGATTLLHSIDRDALIDRARRSLSATPHPFVRWAGGAEARAPPADGAATPESFGTYFEPFVGSGSLFFLIRPAHAVLGDSCRDLIDAYISVRDDPKRSSTGLPASRSIASSSTLYGRTEAAPQGYVAPNSYTSIARAGMACTA